MVARRLQLMPSAIENQVAKLRFDLSSPGTDERRIPLWKLPLGLPIAAASAQFGRETAAAWLQTTASQGLIAYDRTSDQSLPLSSSSSSTPLRLFVFFSFSSSSFVLESRSLSLTVIVSFSLSLFRLSVHVSFVFLSQSMAKARATRQTLDSYTIKSIRKPIKAGDCVLMRPPEPSKPSYVARIVKIESDARGSNVKVHVQWYYRPEESIGGRRPFHGSKELFLSDHHDVQSADTIEGKCTVHTFKSYTKLDAVGNEDFFCRFEYNSTTGAFNPDKVAVYCKCEMPYNPDDLMIQCEACGDWFHPTCISMDVEEARKLEHFFCESCSAEGEKKLLNSHDTSADTDIKVDTKRRRRSGPSKS